MSTLDVPSLRAQLLLLPLVRVALLSSPTFRPWRPASRILHKRSNGEPSHLHAMTAGEAQRRDPIARARCCRRDIIRAKVHPAGDTWALVVRNQDCVAVPLWLLLNVGAVLTGVEVERAVATPA